MPIAIPPLTLSDGTTELEFETIASDRNQSEHVGLVLTPGALDIRALIRQSLIRERKAGRNVRRTNVQFTIKRPATIVYANGNTGSSEEAVVVNFTIAVPVLTTKLTHEDKLDAIALVRGLLADGPINSLLMGAV